MFYFFPFKEIIKGLLPIFFRTQVALDYASKHPKVDLKVVEFGCNKGKGGAIRIGMLSAKGDYMLMADADAATDINDFTKVFEEVFIIIESIEDL